MQSDNRRAMWIMMAAVAAFAMMDASMKGLSAHYQPLQIAAMRAVTSLPLVLVWAVVTGGWHSLRPRRGGLHVLRALLSIAMLWGFVFGLRSLPLSTAYAITFVAPMLVTAMAVPVLKEHIAPGQWMAVVIGLLGVLVILRPTGGGLMSLAGLAVLSAAICYAVSAITVRILARTDSTQSIVVWLLLLLGVGAGALAAPHWVALQTADLGLFAMLGVSGALGQIALTQAFRLGEASRVAPLEYTALLWSVGIDWVFWRVLPDAVTWLGAAIIVAGGLYLLRRERIHVEAEHP